MSVPLFDAKELWSLSEDEFNNWRKENDLPMLFDFFASRLPRFGDWLTEYSLRRDDFLSIPYTSELFTGKNPKILIEYEFEKKLKFDIRDFFDQKDVAHFQHLEIDLRRKMEFLPYLSWAKKILKKQKFIPINESDKEYTNTFTFGSWSAALSPSKSRANLFKTFEVLKLGGVKIDDFSVINGKNLDFTDVDYLEISGDFHGTYLGQIHFSSCRLMKLWARLSIISISFGVILKNFVVRIHVCKTLLLLIPN